MGRVRILFAFLVLALPFADIQVVQAEPVPARPAVIRGNVWYLKDALTSGVAETAFAYGSSSDDFRFMGDWDNDGVKTPGIRRGNVRHLRNSNSTGFADFVFKYGLTTDYPIVGDWDGDGDDTPGVVRFGFGDPQLCSGDRHMVWYLRNSNTAGFADEVVKFGCAATQPVVGDWDGDGDDTPGTWSGHEWSLNNELDGTADETFRFGSLLNDPIVGDWDGDEDETVGVVNGDTWYLLNEHVTSSSADSSFRYGYGPDWKMIWGDASV